MKNGYLPSGREGVLSYIDHFLLKDIAGLFRKAFANELVVGLDLGHITSVTRNHCALTRLRTLQAIKTLVIKAQLTLKDMSV